MYHRRLFYFLFAFGLASISQADTPEPSHIGRVPTVLFVFDASASMAEIASDDGIKKIEVAKNAINILVDKLPSKYKLMLVYFDQDCGQVTVCKELNSLQGDAQRGKLKSLVDGLLPMGNTPLAEAIIAGADQLKNLGTSHGELNMIVLSDGADNCGGNPCAEVRKIIKSGLNVRVHAVGFQVNQHAKAVLECVAREGDGEYFNARDTKQLKDAFEGLRKFIVSGIRPKKNKPINNKGKKYFLPAN